MYTVSDEANIAITDFDYIENALTLMEQMQVKSRSLNKDSMYVVEDSLTSKIRVSGYWTQDAKTNLIRGKTFDVNIATATKTSFVRAFYTEFSWYSERVRWKPAAVSYLLVLRPSNEEK